MTVQIKLLRGFKNHVNNEHNSLSLLVKSDLSLKEHLSNAREKLLVSLTSILENLDSNFVIYFYHKLLVIYENIKEYLCTKDYYTDLDQLITDLDSSIEEVIKMTYGKKVSHFVNITIKLNDDDDVYELNNKEFINLNGLIRSNLSKMNDEENLFVDNNNNDKPIKKKKKNNSKIDTYVKPIKKDTDNYDVNPIKKNKCKKRLYNINLLDGSATLKIETIPIKKVNDDSLFID